VLKTSSHKRRRWKRAKHCFCWIPRKRWAKMVSTFFSLLPYIFQYFWRNLLPPYIFILYQNSTL